MLDGATTKFIIMKPEINRPTFHSSEGNLDNEIKLMNWVELINETEWINFYEIRNQTKKSTNECRMNLVIELAGNPEKNEWMISEWNLMND